MSTKKLTREITLKQFEAIHGDKFDYSNFTEYKNVTQKIDIICNTCGHRFFQRVSNHKGGSGCSKCSSIKARWSFKECLKRLKEIHGNNFYYSNFTKYEGVKQRIKIICKKCKTKFESTINNHMNQKTGCPKCYRMLNSEKCLKRFEITHGDNFDYSDFTKYEGIGQEIKIICKKCKTEFQSTISNHMNNDSGCKTCSKKISYEKYLKEFEEIHGDRYDYSNFVKYDGIYQKIKIICKKCKSEFEQSIHDHRNGRGCPRCNFSKGELNTEKYLKENSIKFEPQKRFKDCRHILPLPFDFYLPDYNICIEFDGEQHYKPIRFNGISINDAKNNFKETQKNDKIKTKYCKNNKIKLIRIPYADLKNINEILEGVLYVKSKSNRENE